MVAATHPGESGLAAGAPRGAGEVFDVGDAAHLRFSREWWRFEARVRASDGRAFATVSTFFRSRTASHVEDALSATSALTDLSSGKRLESQRAGRESLGNAHASAARLDTSVGSWSVRAMRDEQPQRKRFELRAESGSSEISLEFSASARPEISDFRGYFEDANTGESHFSAYTRVAVDGSVTLDGVRTNVTGEAWIDHVYGDAGLSLHPAWSLYEIQLKSGREVMDYVQHRAGGAQVSRSIVIDERGEAHVLPVETTRWRHGAGPYFWRSDRTHVAYPDLYHLVADEFGIDVLVSPATAAQEMVPHGDAPYWDGAMDVVDFASAKRETGTGFAQLTGF